MSGNIHFFKSPPENAISSLVSVSPVMVEKVCCFPPPPKRVSRFQLCLFVGLPLPLRTLFPSVSGSKSCDQCDDPFEISNFCPGLTSRLLYDYNPYKRVLLLCSVFCFKIEWWVSRFPRSPSLSSRLPWSLAPSPSPFFDQELPLRNLFWFFSSADSRPMRFLRL